MPIQSGQVICNRVTYRAPGKKPLIKLYPNFIFLQPLIGNPEYHERFQRLKPGDLVSCIIESMHKGEDGRINCQAYLSNRQGEILGAKSNGHGLRNHNRQKERDRYVSLEHELQSRFGNTLPTQEQAEELARKWHAYF